MKEEDTIMSVDEALKKSNDEWTAGVQRAVDLCKQAEDSKVLVRVELIGLTLALRESLRQFEAGDQPNVLAWVLHTLREKT
jgi:hypothetical protein